MNSKNTSLSKGMEEVLMECHERELMRLQPLNGAANFVKSLHIRGYIESRPYNDKGEIGFFITELGKKYLHDNFS